MITSISPKLFAGSRVLLLLLVPRHPPYALNNFSYFVCFLGFFLFSLFRISKVSLEIFFFLAILFRKNMFSSYYLVFKNLSASEETIPQD